MNTKVWALVIAVAVGLGFAGGASRLLPGAMAASKKHPGHTGKHAKANRKKSRKKHKTARPKTAQEASRHALAQRQAKRKREQLQAKRAASKTPAQVAANKKTSAAPKQIAQAPANGAAPAASTNASAAVASSNAPATVATTAPANAPAAKKVGLSSPVGGLTARLNGLEQRLGQTQSNKALPPATLARANELGAQERALRTEIQSVGANAKPEQLMSFQSRLSQLEGQVVAVNAPAAGGTAVRAPVAGPTPSAKPVADPGQGISPTLRAR